MENAGVETGSLVGMDVVCTELGASEQTIRKYIRQQGLPAFKEGWFWRFNLAEVRAWRAARLRRVS